MQVIPAVNASDFSTAKSLIEKSSLFLGGDNKWLHIDIGDGKFSSIKTWDEPEGLLAFFNLGFLYEIHLMVIDPLNCAEAWLKSGAKKLIIHLETINSVDFHKILKICRKYNSELMLAIRPDTSVEKLIPYFKDIDQFQILAVNPGKSGQEFQESVLGKISYLRQNLPNAKIEVDGGINPTTGKLAKNSGADVLVSANYIFNGVDPQKSFDILSDI